MTIDVAGYMLAIIAIGISFIASRSSFWVLKFIAGIFWWVIAIYWISNSPASIVKGSPIDNIVMTMLFIVGIAFMIMSFWNTNSRGGQEVGRGFRLRLTHSEEDDEAERQRNYLPTMRERQEAYGARVNDALQGRRRGRY